MWNTTVLAGSIIAGSWVMGQWWSNWLDGRDVETPGVIDATIAVGTILGVAGAEESAGGRWSFPSAA